MEQPPYPTNHEKTSPDSGNDSSSLSDDELAQIKEDAAVEGAFLECRKKLEPVVGTGLVSMDNLFRVEEAYWDYLDNMIPQNSDLPRLSFREFFKRFLGLNQVSLNLIMATFSQYKHTLPCARVAFFDPDQVYVLAGTTVRADKFVLPGGKCNAHKGEMMWDCAAREIQEELGEDLANLFRQNVAKWSSPNFFCPHWKSSQGIYVVHGCPRDIPLFPREGEIGKVGWVPLGSNRFAAVGSCCKSMFGKLT